MRNHPSVLATQTWWLGVQRAACAQRCREEKTLGCVGYCPSAPLLHRVNHSKNAIVKPQAKAPEAEKREAEQAMKKVKEASQLIQTVLDPGGWLWHPTLSRPLAITGVL